MLADNASSEVSGLTFTLEPGSCRCERAVSTLPCQTLMVVPGATAHGD